MKNVSPNTPTARPSSFVRAFRGFRGLMLPGGVMGVAPCGRLRFFRTMRLLLFACSVAIALTAAAAPSLDPEFDAALQAFRADGPKGWSFTQTTEGDGHSRVERYDASQPTPARWSLLQQDGRAPTEAERREYRQKATQRSSNDTAPPITKQLDLATLRRVADSAERSTFEARLLPGEQGDATAAHLVASLVFHKSTKTIESFEIASREAFSPVTGVKIAEMRTVMRYSLPAGERPSLLQQITTRVRGRAFLFKSLDADLTVTFSDYENAWRRSEAVATPPST